MKEDTQYGLLQIDISPGKRIGHYTEGNLTITKASVVGDWLSDFTELHGIAFVLRQVFANAPGKLAWLYDLPCRQATIAIQIDNISFPPVGIISFKYLGHVDLPALLEDVLDNLAYEADDKELEPPQEPAKQELATTYFASCGDDNSFGPGYPTEVDAIASELLDGKEPEYMTIIAVKAPAGVHVEANVYEVESDDFINGDDDDDDDDD